MKHPQVTVIMPAYNHEMFIGEAIESVLNQTFEDYEFIVINDGSKDGTERVIKNYTDPRINFYSQENKGAHNALNKGLALAKGKYISILNSDDKYGIGRLSKLVEIAESENSSFLITDLTIIDESSNPVTNPSNWHVCWLERLRALYKKTKSFDAAFLRGNIATSTSNFFFSSELQNRIGYFSDLKYCHDYDFALRALIEYENGFNYVEDSDLLYYRLHKQNTVNQSAYELNKETFELLNEMIPKFVEKRKETPYMKEAQENLDQLNMHMAKALVDESNSQNHMDKLVKTLMNSRLSELIRSIFKMLPDNTRLAIIKKINNHYLSKNVK